MAAVASDVDVGPVQFEARLNIVIEQPQIPGDRVMAGTAVAVEYSVVRIVFAVTADALGIRIGESLRLVTVQALNVVVLTEQRETGQVVVEEWYGQPFAFIVTISALLSQRSIMRIVFEVTRRAFVAGRRLKNRFNMTIDAGN